MPENKEVRKLELCDIAPFVPFGLEAQIDHCGSHKGLVNGLFYNHNSESCSVRAITLFSEDRVPLTKIKPYLRPLDQLTQEITHNGKTFIPLVELNKMRGVATEDEKYTFASECATHYCYWSHTRVFYFEEQTMSFYDDSRHGISPQLEMFQKLHEWHFDLYRLIPSGLAIPIHNTK